MDLGELRRAFLGADAVAREIRDFRIERLGLIESGLTPIRLSNARGPMLVMHVVPYPAPNGLPMRLSPDEIRTATAIDTIVKGRTGSRLNFDGNVVYTEVRSDEQSPPQCLGYVQTFWNGSVEAVETLLFTEREGVKWIYDIQLEDGLIRAFRQYTGWQQERGIQAPIALMVTLLGVRGLVMSTHAKSVVGWRSVDGRPSVDLMFLNPIDRDVLAMPEQIVESFEFDA